MSSNTIIGTASALLMHDVPSIVTLVMSGFIAIVTVLVTRRIWTVAMRRELTKQFGAHREEMHKRSEILLHDENNRGGRGK